ncbi:hypothetical protein I317_04632 [Kwoniella heveanensis CBS 569]|nr:hypothetical protein I317_04632 [Kwoniella heveanensis CBS 569]
MYAPPGVDTSSSGEETTPPPSPQLEPIRHHFSFRSLFTPTKRSKRQGPSKQEIKTSTPVEAAEADPKLDIDPVEPKKRVRIFAGELEKGVKAVKLTDNQEEDVVDPEPETERATAVEAVVDLAPLGPSTSATENEVPKGGDGTATEILTLLRRLMADSKDPGDVDQTTPETSQENSQAEHTDILSKLQADTDKPVKGSPSKLFKENKKGKEKLEKLKATAVMTKEAAEPSELVVQLAPLAAFPGLPPHFFGADGKLLPCHPPGMDSHEYHPASPTPSSNEVRVGPQSAPASQPEPDAKDDSEAGREGEPHMVRGPRRDVQKNKERSIESSKGEVGDTRNGPEPPSTGLDKSGTPSMDIGRARKASPGASSDNDSKDSKKRAELEAVVNKYKARYAETKKGYSKEGLSEEQKKEAKEHLKRAEGKLKEAMHALHALNTEEQPHEESSRTKNSERESAGKKRDDEHTEREKGRSKEHGDVLVQSASTKRDDPAASSRALDDARKTTKADDGKQAELEAIATKYRKRFEDLKKAYAKASDDDSKTTLKDDLKLAEGKMREALQALKALRSDIDSKYGAGINLDTKLEGHESAPRNDKQLRAHDAEGKDSNAVDTQSRSNMDEAQHVGDCGTSPAGLSEPDPNRAHLEAKIQTYREAYEEAKKRYTHPKLPETKKPQAKEALKQAEGKLKAAMRALEKLSKGAGSDGEGNKGGTGDRERDANKEETRRAITAKDVERREEGRGPPKADVVGDRKDAPVSPSSAQISQTHPSEEENPAKSNAGDQEGVNKPETKPASTDEHAELESTVKKHRQRYEEAKKAYNHPKLPETKKDAAKGALKRAESKLREAVQALAAIKGKEGRKERKTNEEVKGQGDDAVLTNVIDGTGSRSGEGEEKQSVRAEERLAVAGQEVTATEAVKTEQSTTAQDEIRLSPSSPKALPPPKADNSQIFTTPVKLEELEMLVKRYKVRCDNAIKALKNDGLAAEERLKAKDDVRRAESKLKEAQQAMQKARSVQSPAAENKEAPDGAPPRQGKERAEEIKTIGEDDEEVQQAKDTETGHGLAEAAQVGKVQKPADISGENSEDRQIGPVTSGSGADQPRQVHTMPKKATTEDSTTAQKSTTDTSSAKPASSAPEKRSPKHDPLPNEQADLEARLKKYKARYAEDVKAYKAASDDKGKTTARAALKDVEAKLKSTTKALEAFMRSGKEIPKDATEDGPRQQHAKTENVQHLQNEVAGGDGKTEIKVTEDPTAHGTRVGAETEEEQSTQVDAAPKTEDQAKATLTSEQTPKSPKPPPRTATTTDRSRSKSELQAQYTKLTGQLESDDLTAHDREKLLRKAEQLRSILSPIPSPIPTASTTRSAMENPRKVADKGAVLKNAQKKYEVLKRGLNEADIPDDERKTREKEVKKQKAVIAALMAEAQSESSKPKSGDKKDDPCGSKMKGTRVSAGKGERQQETQKPKSGGVTPDQVDKAIRQAAKERGERTPHRSNSPPRPAECAASSQFVGKEEIIRPDASDQPNAPGSTEAVTKGEINKPSIPPLLTGGDEHQAWAPLRPSKKSSLPPTPAPPPRSPARGPSPRMKEYDTDKKRISRSSGSDSRAEGDLNENRPQYGTVSWSKTLVALAHCIDLANTLLASLLANKGPNPLTSILQHLVVGLMMQRDLLNSLKGIVDEANGELLDKFGEHVSVIKRYVEGLMEKRKNRVDEKELMEGEQLVQKGSQVLENASVQGVVSYLMTFTEYLTPNMMAALRAIFEEWKKEGLGMKSVIFTVSTIRRELLVILQEGQQEPEGFARTKRLIGLLDRILAFISPETVSPVAMSTLKTMKQIKRLPLPRPPSPSSPPIDQDDVVNFPSPPFRKAYKGSQAIVRNSDATLTHWDEEAEKRVQRDFALRRLTGDVVVSHAPTSSPPILQGFNLPNTSEPFLSPKLYPHQSPQPLQTGQTSEIPATLKKSKSMSFRTLRRSDRGEEAPSSLAYLKDKISNTFHRRHEPSPLLPPRSASHLPLKNMRPVDVSLRTQGSPSEESGTASRRKARPKPIIAPSPSRATYDRAAVTRNRGVDEAYEGMELRLPQTTQDFLGRSKSWKRALMPPLIPPSSDTPTRPETAPLPSDAGLKIRQHHHNRATDLHHHHHPNRNDMEEEWRLYPGRDKGSTIVVPPHSLGVHRAPTPPDPGPGPAQTLYPHSRSRLHRSHDQPQHLPPSPHRGEESSPSIYSPSIASESTLESDEDARRLLALADSGPRPVRHDWRDSLDLDSDEDKRKKKKGEPSAKEVKRAESLLYKKTLPAPHPTRPEKSERRGMTVRLI